MTSPEKEPVRVLMLSPDANFFAGEEAPFGDVRSRHARYARVLRDMAGPASELRVIAYSSRHPSAQSDSAREGLTLIPTRSICRLMFGPDLIRCLLTSLKNWKPDVVTAQSPWAEGLIAWGVAKLMGAKFLAQVHFDIYSPYLAREMRYRFWRPWIARFLLRRAEGVRVVAESVADSVCERTGISRDRIYVSPAPSAFTETDIPLSVKEAPLPVVLYVGRFVASKNLQLWIEVAERVADEMPEVRFRLVGSGPEKENIGAEIAASRHRDRFELVDSVGGAQLVAQYRAADVFLLTSDHEGFGRVIVEAGLAGLPTVSTDSSGPAELIVDGETGFLHRIGDGAALSQSILKLCGDSDLRKRLGIGAKRRMEENFSEDVLVERLVGIWAALARRARG